MKTRNSFWIITILLLLVMSVMTYHIFYNDSLTLFFVVEGLICLILIYIFFFYQRIIKPLTIIGNGMELLREQDFSSRLGHVGQQEADRVVDVFNKMMEQLKNERLLLREQNHFLDLLINASPMGVLILDLEGRIQAVNPALIALLEADTAENLAGKRPDEIRSRLIAQLIEIPLYESETVRLSNAQIYKCTHSSFIDRGFQRDFFLIESLTQEVFKAEKKAYEKVIRMIAHEVNNTTAGITSTLDTLETSFREEDGMEDVCDVLRIAIERCYSMSHFITSFADVVRIPEPNLRTQNLNELVFMSKRFMETLSADRQIDIRLDLAENMPLVRIDPTLFDQVLVNIIKNCVESIGQKGTITIQTSANPISLEIIDNGKGIDPETESRLFTPFFSTKPNGQGIGLILIREILQKHGLAFSLRTESDGLTYFRIRF